MANHDAAPAARASVESVAPQPTTHDDRVRTDKAAARPVAGTGDPFLPQALRILARDIYCEDGVATLAILEAADEIDRLRLIDAEREAVGESDVKATLRGLLERLKHQVATADETTPQTASRVRCIRWLWE